MILFIGLFIICVNIDINSPVLAFISIEIESDSALELCAPKKSLFTKLVSNEFIENSPVLDLTNIFILFSLMLFIIKSNFSLYSSLI